MSDAPTVTVDTSGSLGNALSGVTGMMAKELPGALAEDKANRAIVRDTARAAVSQIDQGTRERGELKAPPMPPPNPPPQHQQTSMADKWGGLAMGMAVLGSAFTRRPAINSLNAAAGVLNAYHDSDAEAYKRNFDNWKAQSDYSLKMYEYQREAYKDAISNIKENSNDALSKLRVVSSAFGDDALKNLASIGNVAGAIAKIDEYNARLPLLRTETALAERRLGLVNDFNAARDALKANPNDPAPSARMAQIMEEAKALKTIESGSGSASDQRFQQENELFSKLKAEQEAALGRPLTASEEAEARRKAHGSVAGTGGGVGADRLKKAEELYEGFIQEWNADPKNAGKEMPASIKSDLWAKAAGSAAGRNPAALTGTLTPEAIDLNADLYIMGDTGVITALPRGGPARIQVENRVAEKLKEMPEGVRVIAMNRMRMAEARSAATTAGRITMNTELFSTEATDAGAELVRVSKTVPRTEFMNVNQLIQAAKTRTGEPKIVALGIALNALRNAYGKMSNPTGTGIHDADKLQFEKIMNTALSHGQIESGVRQIVTEGKIMSAAAQKAQAEVLGRAVPHAPGMAPPAAAAPPPAARSYKPPPPDEAVKQLKDNPTGEMRANFDDVFGPGAAAKALGSE